MENLKRLISSLTYNIYILHPLSRVWWFFLFGLAGWTLLAYIAARTGKDALWRRINAAIATLFTLLLLYMTVTSRSETPYGGIVLRPFYSFYLARTENREYYRTMLMNVLLFFPLGLTLPFAFSKRKHPVPLALAACALLSMCVEALQYIFSLGWTEIDDVIMNTLGALIGCAAYMAAAWLSRLQRRNNDRE